MHCFISLPAHKNGHQLRSKFNSSILEIPYVLLLGEVEGAGILLTILGRGVPPGSPNSHPISDQPMPSFMPVFRPNVMITDFPTKCVVM